MSEPLVRVTDLTRRFGPLTAVDALSLEILRGEMFGLIGPDGAGKTTTLRMILGLVAPDAGTVTTCGLDPLRRRAQVADRVGYLSQRFSLYGDLSIDENLSFFADIHGVRHYGARRDQLLETLRLAPFRGRLADRLSGGMKQKLALACTLIHTPDLLILDEPTTGVDPVSRGEFWRILAGLQEEGLTLIVTTPYLDEAERCTRVGLLHHGRLLDLDRPDRLKARMHRPMLEVIARPVRGAAERLRSVAGVVEVESFGERLHVTLESEGSGTDPKGGDRPAAASAAQLDSVARELRAAGIEVRSVRPVSPSLEDLFIARIRSAESAGQEEVVS